MADTHLETPSNNDECDLNERAGSPETQTDDLFSEDGDSLALASDERRLGLDVIRPWGWSGSSYNDYE
jgi:hypothetical protein